MLLTYIWKWEALQVYQPLKDKSIGTCHAGNEQGLCFTKGNLSGEHTAFFTVTSVSHPKSPWACLCSKHCLWSWLHLGDARHALFLSTASLSVAVDVFPQIKHKQQGKCWPDQAQLLLSCLWALFCTTERGFEFLEKVCSFFHSDIVTYTAYARQKIQANIYQDIYSSMPRKTPSVLSALNLMFLVHLTSNLCFLRPKYL